MCYVGRVGGYLWFSHKVVGNIHDPRAQGQEGYSHNLKFPALKG